MSISDKEWGQVTTFEPATETVEAFEKPEPKPRPGRKERALLKEWGASVQYEAHTGRRYLSCSRPLPDKVKDKLVKAMRKGTI